MKYKNIKNAIMGFTTNRIKILAYHSVYKYSRDLYEIDSDMFKLQMDILKENDFDVITLEEALGDIEGGTIKHKTIVITFDDAFNSLCEYAFPVLRGLSYPATVFVPFDYIGKIDSFSYDHSRDDFKIMSLSEIESSKVDRISYGSHTMTHSDLTDLNQLDLDRELFESKVILNNEIGEKFSALAYPFGMFNDRIKKAVDNAGYDCAVCFGNVLSNSRYTEKFELKREKILSTTPVDEFKRKIDISQDFPRKVNSMISRKIYKMAAA